MKTKFGWLMFVLGFMPLAWLLANIQAGQLGANPIQAIHIYLGDWTLRFLCLNLAVTPFIMVTHWHGPFRYRRMIGLFTFFYATLHVLAYVILDQALAWRMIGWDIIEGSFIVMGLITYLILLFMAVTATPIWERHFGFYVAKSHRLIYIAAITAIAHYAWQLKGNLAEPLMYALIIVLLLGFRALAWRRARRAG